MEDTPTISIDIPTLFTIIYVQVDDWWLSGILRGEYLFEAISEGLACQAPTGDARFVGARHAAVRPRKGMPKTPRIPKDPNLCLCPY